MDRKALIAAMLQDYLNELNQLTDAEIQAQYNAILSMKKMTIDEWQEWQEQFGPIPTCK